MDMPHTMPTRKWDWMAVEYPTVDTGGPPLEKMLDELLR